mmetsp:Transcript_27461/g.24338  ORF Transcript_27461/g.24338 Transcript_27461/m.24338 type:complete len:112 (+) Transcript_27461:467-802(+)
MTFMHCDITVGSLKLPTNVQYNIETLYFSNLGSSHLQQEEIYKTNLEPILESILKSWLTMICFPDRNLQKEELQIFCNKHEVELGEQAPSRNGGKGRTRQKVYEIRIPKTQ